MKIETHAKEIESLENIKKEIEWNVDYHSEKLKKFMGDLEAINLALAKIKTS